MKVIVIGGGKIGFYLAKTLIEHNHHVSMIEQSKSICSHIANKLDIPVYCGDGSTIHNLEMVEAHKSDALIAVTGRDQDNMIACQLGKQVFNIEKTIARVNNPKNTVIMKRLGVDIAISATDNIARLLEREIDTSTMKKLISVNQGEASLNEIEIPANYKLHGTMLMDIKIPNDSIIVSITRKNRLEIPRGNTQILSGDSLIILSKDDSLHKLSKVLKLI